MTNIINPYRFAAAGFSPTDIAGLTAWFDASDASTLYTDTSKTTPVSSDGDTIQLWADKSANGYDVSNASSTALYKTSVINSLDVALFNGSSTGYLKNTGSCPVNNSSDGSWTIVAVAQWTTLTGAQSVVDGDAGSGSTRVGQFIKSNSTAAQSVGFQGAAAKNDGSGETLANTTLYYLKTVNTGTTIEMFVNNNTDGSLACVQNYSATCPLSIGGLSYSASQGMQGYICEVIAYDSDLAPGDMSSVESYLSSKWGVTV